VDREPAHARLRQPAVIVHRHRHRLVVVPRLERHLPLDDYRRLAPAIRRLLAPGGAAVIEIGWTQADSVGDLLRAQGFAVAVHRDLGDRPRALLAT